MLAGSRDEQFDTGQIACGCCRGRVKVALTDDRTMRSAGRGVVLPRRYMRGGGLILAAPASGSGKTLLTLGLLRLLRDRGVRVAAAKAGPDYIDPTFHAAASGGVCLNLDAWAMREATLAGAGR